MLYPWKSSQLTWDEIERTHMKAISGVPLEKWEVEDLIFWIRETSELIQAGGDPLALLDRLREQLPPR